MDLTEIPVTLKTIEVSVVLKKTRYVNIQDDEAHNGEITTMVEIPLAKPYLHINCVMESIDNNQFIAGCDYVDKNENVYHAANCDTIVLVTQKLEQFMPPNKVIMFNRPYKEG